MGSVVEDGIMGFINDTLLLTTGAAEMSKLFKLLKTGAAAKAGLFVWLGDRGCESEKRSSMSFVLLAGAGLD